MAKTLAQAFEESINSRPELGTYVHLCHIFAESGASKNEVKKAFMYYMSPDEYDKSEIEEMINYLHKIATEIPE